MNNTDIEVSLISPKSKKKLASKSASIGKGKCIFPFKYKGESHTKCIPNKSGDLICSTENDSSGKMKTFAYCKTSKAKSNPANKGKPKSKNNSNAKTEVKSKNNSNAKTEVKSKKGVKKFKVFKFSPDLVDKKYLIPSKDNIDIKSWELPNRKTFPKWLSKKYKPYEATTDSLGSGPKGRGFNFFKHQKLIRDYLNINSPYRGLLLYHGLGVGKTCASIAVAEGFRNNRDIIVLMNKSLVSNFKVNLMKCGFELFRISQHWVFHDLSDSKDPMTLYAKHLGIPNTLIKKHGGAWFIDFTKEPNYNTLIDTDQSTLDTQIKEMIESKYTFLHLDGLNKSKLDSMNRTKLFDNKLVIIDEVHNLTNAMSKPYPGVRGKGLKQLIMDADNLKLTFLSGTPMINNLFEAGQLFNILRGYIEAYQITLIKKPGSKSYDEVMEELKKVELIDQIIPKKSDNIINIVRNPHGFITTKDGIVNSPINSISDEEFKRIMKEKFAELNYNVAIIKNKYTALPDNEEEFMNLFYDEINNKIKNPKLLQSRILGLVSYFKTQSVDLLPTVTKNEVIEIPMSNYQFLAYSLVRKAEIDQDKGKKGDSKPKSKSKALKRLESAGDPQNNLFQEKSSYRAYSRMHCSFVFPETIPRPYPNDGPKINLKDEIVEFKKLVSKHGGNLDLTNELKKFKIVSEVELIRAQLSIIDHSIKSETHGTKEYISLDNIKNELEDNIKALQLKQINNLDEGELKEKDYDIQDKGGPANESSPEDKKDKKKNEKLYDKAKVRVLKELYEDKHNLFTLDDPEQLLKYSPKYHDIIKKCNSVNGLSFIYTEYKTLEGIAILEIIFKANGYGQFKLKEVKKGEYSIDIDKGDIGKPMFAFWGGDEKMSDIIRKVYNNQFEELPVNIKKQLEKLFPGKHNKRGDIIKILMTTKSGAEGIDLQNVRQVHIVEPYWNPVRTEQVKGRAVRVGSHLQLPVKDRTVEIYTYLSVITPEDLKKDITIKDDKNGMTSDQVLFDISQRKLQVMNHFLTLIKEASIDCNINLKETLSDDNYFECVKYGSKSNRDNYSYIPNIKEEHGDQEMRRRVQNIKDEYTFKLLPIKGKQVSFAVNINNSSGDSILLYDSDKIENNELTKPLAKFNETMKKLTVLDKKAFKSYIK